MRPHRDAYPKYVRRNVQYLGFYRKNRLMTQVKLARMLRVPSYKVSEWEQRLKLPSKAKYNELAEIFDWEKWK